MLEVVGAGLGRTGTLSLKLALEQLGFNKCYHMMEVFEHPDHVKVWTSAVKGEAVDWDKLFTGYRASVDWPACHFYRQLADKYPRSKVVLTARDPEKWYKSFSETIMLALQAPLPPVPALREHLTMVRDIVSHQVFGDRLGDKNHVVETYRRHIADVKKAIQPERLLVYEVSEGWEPLCKFLGVPVPKADFPRTNSTDEFVARMQAIRQG